MPAFSGLFKKLFLAVAAVVAAYGVLLYLLVLPQIKSALWENESRTIGLVLDSVDKAVRTAGRDPAVLSGLLEDMRFCNTGKVFVFNGQGEVLSPASAKQGVQSLLSSKNTDTGNPLAEDLVRSAQYPRELFFTVDGRRRAAWVRALSGEDWYAAAWVDSEEIAGDLGALWATMAALTVLLALVVLLAAWVIIGRLISPIRRLSDVARQVEKGDIDATCDVAEDDEIGRLSCTFNAMVARLRASIEELDAKVKARTAELAEKNERLESENALRKAAENELAAANARLTRWVGELEENNRRMARLNSLSDDLQAAASEKEALSLAANAAKDLFSDGRGAFFWTAGNGERFIPSTWWPAEAPAPEGFLAEDCPCLQEKAPLVAKPGEEKLCAHDVRGPGMATVCVPLAAHGEVLGVLNFSFDLSEEKFTPGQAARRLEIMPRMAVTVADHTALAVSNIRLRDRLQGLSVRDPLTGLFNRRYMEETLIREASRALRNDGAVGIVMLDVDRFKDFNDSFGHEAGDFLLRKLGLLLANSVRAGDVACRYGGEEFVLILPGADLQNTFSRAEEIRRQVAKELFLKIGGQHRSATVSAGVAVFPDHGADIHAAINAADKALYLAKKNGRNRVEKAG
ncbi:MAG: diguanylate cyclase [Deltaproteobacteria bacterium]|nr:diguanylate cyclase [Deltaproteobacteria bacterium]